MRNIPIPVDTARLTFVCVTDPRPRLISKDTGEIKTDRNGQTVYQVGLSAADVSWRAAGPRRPGRAARRAGRVRVGAGPRRPDPLGHRLPGRFHHPGSRGQGRVSGRA